MANQAPIRILAVDDHALLRKGIRMLISTESDMQLVAEASTGREAVQEFRTHRPDITLMDLQMPDMSGVEAIIAIRGEFPNARVIVLTTYAGDAQVLRALNAGARGYLLKGKINTELLETIRGVHSNLNSELSSYKCDVLLNFFTSCVGVRPQANDVSYLIAAGLSDNIII